MTDTVVAGESSPRWPKITPEEWAAVLENFRQAGENAAEAARLFKEAWAAFKEEFNRDAPKDTGDLK